MPEAEYVDVMCPFQHAISIIEKRRAKNLAFLQRRKSTQGTRTASGDFSSEGRPQGQELSANSVNDDEAYHRTDHRRHTRKAALVGIDQFLIRIGTQNSRQCSQHRQRRETRSREDYETLERILDGTSGTNGADGTNEM